MCPGSRLKWSLLVCLSSSLHQDPWVTGRGARVSSSHPCQVHGGHLQEALPSSGPSPDLWDGSPAESPSPTLRHFHFHSSPGSTPTRFRGNWKHRSPKKKKRKAWALSGPHNESVSCCFPKQVQNPASSAGYCPCPWSSILLRASWKFTWTVNHEVISGFQPQVTLKSHCFGDHLLQWFSAREGVPPQTSGHVWRHVWLSQPVVVAGKRCYYHPVGGSQRCCYCVIMHRSAPITKNYPDQNTHSVQVEKPWSTLH